MKTKKKVDENGLKYYDIRDTIKKHPDCQYYVSFGIRSSGKTYSSLMYGLERGGQIAYIRRYDEDIKSVKAQQIFNGLIANNEISKITNGEFTSVCYYNKAWYYCNYDEELGKNVRNSEPIMYGFSLGNAEHYKGSTGYPKIKTIIFDEFITNDYYYDNEFSSYFCNILSSILRKENENDVKILMLGNTISYYCPYFKEMGFKHIEKMQQGDIVIYQYGKNSDLKVCLERTIDVKGGNTKHSTDKYFAFDNPKLEMITGNGTNNGWELDIYPHLPFKYLPKEIMGNFFIEFDEIIYQGDIVCKDNCLFIYIHKKTTPIKNIDYDIVYSLNYNAKPNYLRSVYKPINKFTKLILDLFNKDKVFYQDNEVGDGIKNYLLQSMTNCLK